MTNKSAIGADSISIGGATQGTDALAVTGTANVSGLIAAGSGVQLGGFSTFLGSPANATTRFGAADAAAPVAQTIGVQNVVAGTSNTAGANTNFDCGGGSTGRQLEVREPPKMQELQY
jgi:hypothetical protein